MSACGSSARASRAWTTCPPRCELSPRRRAWSTAIPSGTRDVLPDEMAELRAMTDRIRAVFAAAGYGEVYTPALEYETTFPRESAPRPAYRVFDEHGHVLVLRADMTVPIARRGGHALCPRRSAVALLLRRSRLSRRAAPARAVARVPPGRRRARSARPDPKAPPRSLRVLCAALEAAGLADFRVGVGDASLYPALLDGLGVAPTARERILAELVQGDFVGVEREIRALNLDDAAAGMLLTVPRTRGRRRGARSLPRPAHRATGRDARPARPARARRGPAGHLRPRARAQPQLLHRRGISGL